MCGILGTIGYVPSAGVRADALKAVHHRGPDSAGECQYVTQDTESRTTEIWFGHTRLSILDLTGAGAQPMASADGRWWVTFNGEIFNHDELRKELDVRWRGHSDTETLVEALSAWGLDKTLQTLNGMFAFAAIDIAAGAVYLVRDPFGIKPLYYTRAGKGFCFSSEVKALVKLTGLKYRVDRDALQTFLSLRFVPSPYTLLEGIQRVPPAHYVAIDVKGRGVQIRRYVAPPINRFSGTVEEAAEEYQGLLKKAVRRQLLSDVPVGVFLSGGVDSALVAAIAATSAPHAPCFSVGFGPAFPECELSDAGASAAALGLRMIPVLVTPEDLWSVFQACIASIEEPLGTCSMLPMWHLARHARDHVTVVLTGQGSDEPWGGYRRYQAELWRCVPFVRLMAKSCLPLLQHFSGAPDFVARALAGIPISDIGSRFEREYCLFSDVQRAALTGRGDYGRAVDNISYWLAWCARRTGADGAEKMMSIDSRMGLADDLLLYGDKISMAHSLEARVPMLDIELVRFVESLPRRYRVSFRQGKITHKLAAERYLPVEIVHRKKKGFPMPFAAWIRTVWKHRVETVLFQQDGPHLNWMRMAGLRLIWDEHQRARDRSRQIFALLAFAFWCRAMMECLEQQP